MSEDELIMMEEMTFRVHIIRLISGWSRPRKEKFNAELEEVKLYLSKLEDCFFKQE